MDGIDGIAAGQAITAGLGWAIVGWLADDLRPMLLGGLLTATSAGFLVHNWSPASIFMGDIGSAFLGYCFATLGLLGGGGGSGALIGILLVWPFVFDTAFTFCVRLRRRENIFKAHRSHLYQRLVLTGLSHRAVTLLYVALAVLGAAAGRQCRSGLAGRYWLGIGRDGPGPGRHCGHSFATVSGEACPSRGPGQGRSR